MNPIYLHHVVFVQDMIVMKQERKNNVWEVKCPNVVRYVETHVLTFRSIIPPGKSNYSVLQFA